MPAAEDIHDWDGEDVPAVPGFYRIRIPTPSKNNDDTGIPDWVPPASMIKEIERRKRERKQPEISERPGDALRDMDHTDYSVRGFYS